MSSVFIKNGCTFEFVVSQIASKSDSKILCVKDGYELLMFKSLSELPQGLSRECRRDNKDITTTEYHWRSDALQSTYVFFSRDVDNYLKQIEAKATVKRITLPGRKSAVDVQITYHS